MVCTHLEVDISHKTQSIHDTPRRLKEVKQEGRLKGRCLNHTHKGEQNSHKRQTVVGEVRGREMRSAGAGVWRDRK